MHVCVCARVFIFHCMSIRYNAFDQINKNIDQIKVHLTSLMHKHEINESWAIYPIEAQV